MDAATISVLIVDDEPGFVEVLQKRLAKRDIAVTGALSGAEAIRTLRGRDFDCAVLDLKMGDMDGIEVLEIFKRMVPDMPVLMLTGHGSELAARQGVAAGAFDYMTKPCELDELVAKIRLAADAGRTGHA